MTPDVRLNEMLEQKRCFEELCLTLVSSDRGAAAKSPAHGKRLSSPDASLAIWLGGSFAPRLSPTAMTLLATGDPEIPVSHGYEKRIKFQAFFYFY